MPSQNTSSPDQRRAQLYSYLSTLSPADRQRWHDAHPPQTSDLPGLAPGTSDPPSSPTRIRRGDPVTGDRPPLQIPGVSSPSGYGDNRYQLPSPSQIPSSPPVGQQLWPARQAARGQPPYRTPSPETTRDLPSRTHARRTNPDDYRPTSQSSDGPSSPIVQAVQRRQGPPPAGLTAQDYRTLTESVRRTYPDAQDSYITHVVNTEWRRRQDQAREDSSR